jgi:hypothetical protein
MGFSRRSSDEGRRRRPLRGWGFLAAGEDQLGYHFFERRTHPLQTSRRQGDLYQELGHIVIRLYPRIQPLHDRHIDPRQDGLDRGDGILNLLDFYTIPQHDLTQPLPPLLFVLLMRSEILEDDPGAIKNLDALVQHYFLDDSCFPRLSGDRTRAGPFERVDEG